MPVDMKGYATNMEHSWLYPPTYMPPSGVKLHILTTGGIAIHDNWRWDAGYVGWQYLPKRDLVAEEAALHYINNGAIMSDKERMAGMSNAFAEKYGIIDTQIGLQASDSVNQWNVDAVNLPSKRPTDIIGVVNRWNLDAGRTEGVFNPRQTAFYTGMQCEELAEKLVACGLDHYAELLEFWGKQFKTGELDAYVTSANRKKLLDADADIVVVTAGSAQGQGAEFHGAVDAVLAANEAKRFPDGKLHKDANGKILKPEGWKEPDLTPYLAK